MCVFFKEHFVAKTDKLSNGSARLAAFSLIEVTMALGVASFALVTLMGLLPLGIITLAQSRDLTLEAQIGQRLITEARQTSFSQLSAMATNTPYFDAEGNPSSSATGSDHVYEATTVVTYNTGISVNATPVSATDVDQANAASVAITISKISSPAAPRKVSVCVANNGT